MICYLFLQLQDHFWSSNFQEKVFKLEKVHRLKFDEEQFIAYYFLMTYL